MRVHLFDLLVTLASALDLVESSMYTHHHRVAYISFRIAEKMGLDGGRIKSLVHAALIHDVGVITKKEKESVLEFNVRDTERHSERGYNFLKDNDVFSGIAPIVRDHHKYFENENGTTLESAILHLADRMEVLIRSDRDIFTQSSEITAKLLRQSGTMFDPKAVHALQAVSGDMNFWQILKSPNIFEWLSRRFRDKEGYLTHEQIESISRSVAKIIDFRSRFMYAHSTNVAIISEMLGKKFFTDPEMIRKLRIAGYLHDMGKLVIPEETIDKGNALTGAEKSLINTHPFYTNILLKQMEDLEDVPEMAAYHHERLDGSGYPFHVDAERFEIKHQIIGISDILAALNEDRAYRLKKNKNYISGILEEYRKAGLYSGEVIAAAEGSIENILEMTADNGVRMLNEYVEWNKNRSNR